METPEQIIARLKRKLGVRSNYAIAKTLGITQSNISLFRTAPPDPAMGSDTAELDGKLLADLEAFARLVGHAQTCARGCRFGRHHVFSSAACEEGTRLALGYREVAPYCCRDADPTAARSEGSQR